MRKHLLFLLVPLLLALSACSGTSQQKATLHIYCGFEVSHMDAVVERYEAKTGIDVIAERYSANTILEKIRGEKDAPWASVWLGGPADTFVSAKTEGLLDKYVSHNAAEISDSFKDYDGYWTGIYIGYLGFISDRQLLDELGVDAPESWEDLLDPKLEGHIVMPDMETSGTAYTFLATLVQLWGEEKTKEYMKSLNNQISEYTSAGVAPAEMAAEKKTAVGISFIHNGYRLWMEGASDLVLTAPSEGTGYEIGAIALIKDAPEAEAACRFIDWFLTAEGQEIGQSAGQYQSPTCPDAEQSQISSSIAAIQVIPYDVFWAGEQRERLIGEWKEWVGRA